jgi:hypothetical protein
VDDDAAGVGLGERHLHGEGRFTDLVVTEDGDTLAFDEREELVGDGDAGGERLVELLALDDAGRHLEHGVVAAKGDGAFAVERLAGDAEHAADDGVPYPGDELFGLDDGQGADGWFRRSCSGS